MLENKTKKQSKRLVAQLLHKFKRQRNNHVNSKLGLDNNGRKPEILNVYREPNKEEVAQVILNGYNIDQDKSFGSLGAMRSFKIVRGDLWDQWNEQTAVVLANDTGLETLVRVAALPVDDASFGLIEFVSHSELNSDA